MSVQYTEGFSSLGDIINYTGGVFSTPVDIMNIPEDILSTPGDVHYTGGLP